MDKFWERLSFQDRLLAFFIVLNLYDFFSTKLIVGLAGSSAEANPAMRWVIEQYGIWGILGAKILVIVLFAGAIRLIDDNRTRFLTRRSMTAALGVLCGAMSFVGIWNTFVIYRMFSV